MDQDSLKSTKILLICLPSAKIKCVCHLNPKICRILDPVLRILEFFTCFCQGTEQSGDWGGMEGGTDTGLIGWGLDTLYLVVLGIGQSFTI